MEDMGHLQPGLPSLHWFQEPGLLSCTFQWPEGSGQPGQDQTWGTVSPWPWPLSLSPLGSPGLAKSAPSPWLGLEVFAALHCHILKEGIVPGVLLPPCNSQLEQCPGRAASPFPSFPLSCFLRLLRDSAMKYLERIWVSHSATQSLHSLENTVG